jgi:hypothetical protein
LTNWTAATRKMMKRSEIGAGAALVSVVTCALQRG